MPMFDYICLDCRQISEVLITGSGDAPRCRSCGGDNLEKLLSVPSSLSGPPGNRMPGPGTPLAAVLRPAPQAAQGLEAVAGN
jgi:putative FmdB family regulatory protein